jgi:hypothetical protein
MFYIWLNVALSVNWYWMQSAQNWTSHHADATLFATREAAEAEAVHARAYGPGEVEVRQKSL